MIFKKHVKTVLAVLAASLAAFSLCFAQARPAGRQDCIAVYGDSRIGDSIHDRIVDDIVKIKPKAVFHVGDVANDGRRPEDWVTPMVIISKLREKAEVFAALGNHDFGSDLFYRTFGLPVNQSWYSVERCGIHFIVLDSTSPIRPGSAQYKWLKDDLKGIKDKNKFIAVMLHYSIITSGHHQRETSWLQHILPPLFEKRGVDIVFSGHDHDYERSLYHGIYYVVTGGGGQPLRKKAYDNPYSQVFVSTHHFCRICKINNRLVVTAFDRRLNIIDEFSVVKR